MKKSEHPLKECNICKNFLPFSEFHNAGKYLMSMCKKCQNNINKIRENKTKIKIITEYFNGKCHNCDIDIVWLPSLDFHHINPLKKQYHGGK